MADYVIFDNLIEGINRAPFDAIKTLLEKAGIEASPIVGIKSDVGYDARSLDIEAYNAIFDEALEKAENATIIALENSSFLGLKAAQRRAESSVEIILAIDLVAQNLKDIELKHPFSNFNAGIYYGSDDVEQSALTCLLALSCAKEIKLNRAYNDSGYALQNINKSTAYKMAGNIMLDVFDTSCDFVIVNDIRAFEMFDTKQAKLACEVGRDIGLSGLPVFSIAQILLIAMGEIEASKVSENLVAPTFL